MTTSLRAALMVCLMFLGTLFPASPAQAKGCVSTWDYSVASLQEARRRLKSPAHKTLASRVSCGSDVNDALTLAEMPEDCPACRLEYINFMRDFIEFTRKTAEKSAVREYSLEYYQLEIDLRLKLGKFLIETKNDGLIQKYWSPNFEGLGDAMDRSDLGERFHQEVTRNASRTLSAKSIETWVKAVRSCEAWDFRSGERRTDAALKQSLLCVAQCRRALTRIRDRVGSGQDSDAALNDYLEDNLPALDSCPTGATP